MRTKIIRSFYLSLLIIIFITGISGGANKRLFKALVQKPGSISTVIYVYDLSVDSAKENIALNGWKVLQIEEVSNGKDYKSIKNISGFGNLKLIKTFYFKKGEYRFNLDNETISFFRNLNRDKVYYIYGHTDSLPVKPNNKYRNNYELSILRAEFIKELIRKYSGIDSNAKIVGFGAFFPLVSNGLQGAEKNRRVELYESF
ncbi:hypothetical protein DEFDS_0426 [Deferribacter desulfuricans SSM1]|uniref:OmpA-like domain-containing protein n=1 Tax=Deferribacter desulfuricans (strain DSM 14783 / JCM 11476 / NBRC 101012 / SSM1) TaxID=639282 RepID=D3PBE7_DEFDS|nr:OmpA family protein [Deferribacter desulfuricans]BAI79920.1 hypothetical protein DEFDS_0426 [Deferribacter desulfuricans SSM1]